LRAEPPTRFVLLRFCRSEPPAGQSPAPAAKSMSLSFPGKH
jgi:hypothetical protein